MDRRSYLCVPIVESDEVLGLVYLDSSDPKALPPDESIASAAMLDQFVAHIRAALS